MHIQSLSGDWQFRQINSELKNGFTNWMPAQVPGGVHTDLLALQKIPDPFVADHELDVQWVANSDWEYQRSFDIDDELLKLEEVYLVCEGLDTLASVYLNDDLMGRAENMFRQYQWSIKTFLRPGSNTISIVFDSPTRFVAERNAEKTLLGVSQAIPGGPHLRKAPCQFGWDWGPMLPPVGIWKDLRLEGYSYGKFDEVHFRHSITAGKAIINAGFSVQKISGGSLSAQLAVTAPDGVEAFLSEVSYDETGSLSIDIPEPHLWWPNGYGKQPLYQVTLFLRQGIEILDQKTVKMGLRTVELLQEPDEWGKSFTFVVNGVPVFAKGSNWIPADSFPTRLDRGFLEKLIKAAADSFQNMLRVWGGGFYEDDTFYDLCDQYGLLVWQDLIFSCSIYPLDDPEFVNNVKVEIDQNVKRLRHRASLALWCGNNEMEWGWESWGWKQRAFSYREPYDHFFHNLLPAWIAEFDPDHAYWPSSPSSNTPFENVNGQQVGDAHYWEVWHGRKPFTAYRDQFPRFMSEFGFQSLPPLQTIKTYAAEEDWNMTSYIMEHHQRSGSGNGLMIGQMTDTFRMPKDFDALVYLSMVLQAEGIRYGVEHWRRNKHRVSGTLYWQLNDCWPVASWSSLDYYGRWKALHYAARRFFAPLLVSIEDQGLLIEVHVTSDLLEPWSGNLAWMLVSLDGETLEKGTEAVTAGALESKMVISTSFNLDAYQRRNSVFVCTLAGPGVERSYRVAAFAPNKHLNLSDPELDIIITEQASQFSFEVTAKHLARFVELSIKGSDVVFSDNYFDIPGGQSVIIRCDKPSGMSLETVRNKIHCRSLFDSFR